MISLDLDLEADLGIDSIKRIEILTIFQSETSTSLTEHMDDLTKCRTLQAVVDQLTTQRAETNSHEQGVPVGSEDGEPRLHEQEVGGTTPPPFVAAVTRLEHGVVAEVQCKISTSTYPFLRHHSLGRETSTLDAKATGLPVMPFTMSMEIIAEVAHLLVPDHVVVGFRDVRASRWIAVDAHSVMLDIFAVRQVDHTDRVDVRIYDQRDIPDGDRSLTLPRFEGTVVFARSYPPAPIAVPGVLVDGQPSRWDPERLYQDGMFHGPMFRGVTAMQRSGANGATATLTTLPRDGLFAESEPTLLTDPVLLDQPGQVLALWLAEQTDQRYVIFPFSLAELHLYGPPLPENRTLHTTVGVRAIDEGRVCSDLDIVDGEHIWARFVGWEDRRFDVPSVFFQFLLDPTHTSLSKPWALPDSDGRHSTSPVAVTLDLRDFPDAFFIANSGIWQQVLVHLILTPDERERWEQESLPPPNRVRSLLERLAVKDAVREYLRMHHSLTVCPADIEIVTDALGHLTADGTWKPRLPTPLSLSVVVSNNAIVAVVEHQTRDIGGVDAMVLDRLEDAHKRPDLSHDDMHVLTSIAEGDVAAWVPRIQAAKQAVAKAIGREIVDDRNAFELHTLDAASGTVQIRLGDNLAHQIGTKLGSIVTVFTSRDGDVVMATAAHGADGSMEESVV